MATTTTASNLGPLTTTFTPNGPDCKSTYFNIVSTVTYTDTAGNAIYNVGTWLLNGPSSSAECYPGSWITDISSEQQASRYYSPGVCPSGFAVMCQSLLGEDDRTTQGTCCPRCVNLSANARSWASWSFAR